MSNSISAHGTLLQIGDGEVTEAFTTIAEVKAISGPNITQVIKEVTNHSSAGWVERLPILVDGGDVSFEINFIPSDGTHSYAAGLLGDSIARTKRNFKLIFPDGGSTTWAFAAYVSEFSPAAPSDDVLTASVTLTIAEAPTLA
jgi:hypothetical protein